MKKFIFAAVFFMTAIFAFADSDDVSSTGIFFSVGDLVYPTNRFSESPNLNRRSDDLWVQGGSLEAGLFRSDEDGLFDFVTSDRLCIGFGKVNTYDNYIWEEKYDDFIADSDAEFFNINMKDLFGLQVNFFVLSAGILAGSNLGFDWLKMDAAGYRTDYTYRERRLYCDFVLEPYFAVNIVNRIKLILSSEFDLPVIRARFIKNSDSRDYNFKLDWFKNDIPAIYKAGVVIFL